MVSQQNCLLLHEIRPRVYLIFPTCTHSGYRKRYSLALVLWHARKARSLIMYITLVTAGPAGPTLSSTRRRNIKRYRLANVLSIKVENPLVLQLPSLVFSMILESIKRYTLTFIIILLSQNTKLTYASL